MKQKLGKCSCVQFCEEDHLQGGFIQKPFQFNYSESLL